MDFTISTNLADRLSVMWIAASAPLYVKLFTISPLLSMMMMYPQAKALCCDTHLPPALVVPMYVVNANVRGGVGFSIVCKGKHAPGFWVCNLHR